MATLGEVLDAATALPAAIEGKWTKLPKISQGLVKFDSMIPAGPDIFPAPPAFPVPDLSKLSKNTPPPNIFRGPSTVTAKMPYPVNVINAPPSRLPIYSSPNPVGQTTGQVIERRGF
jgi:hypothetical protein